MSRSLPPSSPRPEGSSSLARRSPTAPPSPIGLVSYSSYRYESRADAIIVRWVRRAALRFSAALAVCYDFFARVLRETNETLAGESAASCGSGQWSPHGGHWPGAG